jgi:hypothetical protein
MGGDMVFKNFALRLIAIASILPCISVGAQSVMEPGGWQMKMKVSAQDPLTGKSKIVKKSSSKMCLSKAFLSKDPYLIPGINKEKMERNNAKCSISDEERTQNSASWKMTCLTEDGKTVDMSIKNIVSAHSLNSEVRQVIKKGGRTAFLNISVDSSFIGKCTIDMLNF